jgi:predicted amidohydrolase YtcJ
VLDASPLAVDPERICDIQVLATVLGGTPVYQPSGQFSGAELNG